MSNELKFLLSRKPITSFLNYFSTTSFAIALKISFSGRKRIFLSKFLYAASFANAKKVNISEFQVKN